MLIALAAAAFVAGLAGAWSPCGFSMVDTLAPQGYAQRMRTTVVACMTFALGALAGGVATFGGLALLGGALGAGQGGAVAIAVALLLAAAAGDLAGRRIVPQVRRQVPESWRRVLPVPLAAGLYGVLLGLGFTTFVLSFAVYALAAACLALGDVQAGLAVGLAFAAGRIAPVVALAPAQATERGIDIAAAMAERPGVLRAIRAAGALALGVAALVVALAGAPASAATQSLLTDNGTDPSTSAGSVAWQLPGGGNGLVAHGADAPQSLPGTDPALGPDAIVWREGEALVVADRFTLRERCGSRRRGPRSPRCRRAGWCGGRASRAATCCARSICRRSISRRSTSAASGRPTASAARRSTATASSSTSASGRAVASRRSTCRRGGARRCAPAATARSCSTPAKRAASCCTCARRRSASRC